MIAHNPITRTRDDVTQLADDIEREAVAAGWRRPRRLVCSGGSTVYLRLQFGTSRADRRACVRVSNHAPGRPIGEDGEPMLVATVGVAGAFYNAARWLRSKAQQHREDAAYNAQASERSRAVLRALRERPGLTLHELAVATDYDPAEVDALVGWLAERSMVEVRESPDKRTYLPIA